MKEKAKQDLTNTDYLFKLYNQAHLYQQINPLKEPQISNICDLLWENRH